LPRTACRSLTAAAVLTDAEFGVAAGDAVAVAGPNGSGKTTLIDAILGRAPLSAGRRSLGPSVVVGEIDQSRRTFDPASPLNHSGPLAVPTVTASGEEAVVMMRRLLGGVGLLVAVAGVIFTLQGLGAIGGSAMTGVTFWALAGPVIALAGLLLALFGLRRRPAR
jgi:energy-coupling factor transporter ATP-binding protein EcfA2